MLSFLGLLEFSWMHSGEGKLFSSSSLDSFGVGGVLDELESSLWNMSEELQDDDEDAPDDPDEDPLEDDRSDLFDSDCPSDLYEGDCPSDSVS